MKISWQCLSNSGFIKPWPKELRPQSVADQLTMVGLELEQLEPLGDSDALLDINITPNRGDCLSARGLCREIAALNDLDFHDRTLTAIKTAHEDRVSVIAREACPLYAGQWYDVPAVLPDVPQAWLDCLAASGIASIHPIVDLSHYVMLLLGQPLHAFDADKIGNLKIDFAVAGENFEALGNKVLKLDSNTLVIRDEQGVQAIAGVIGGLNSGVTSTSRQVFIESAHFVPAVMAGTARRYGLQTDAAYRFERGVDPALPLLALQLFDTLAKKHLHLDGSSLVVIGDGDALCTREPIFLRAGHIERLLGVEIHVGEVEKILKRLGMEVEAQPAGWQVIPPSCRFDIRIEADLIEELARHHGYGAIPAAPLHIGEFPIPRMQSVASLANVLVAAGYHEVISYSFIGETLHQACFTQRQAIRLQNPLSSELAVMRVSLWPSLLQTYIYNQARQQSRAQLYESGRLYQPDFDAALGTYAQPRALAGLLCGSRYGETWAAKARPCDFFDAKADVEKLLSLFAPLDSYRFSAATHEMLHPGQSAAVYYHETLLGHIGKLHPRLQQALGCHQEIYLFELLIDLLPQPGLPQFRAFSKFPTIQRRFAFFVRSEVAMHDFCDAIKHHLGEQLVDLTLFDVYQGKGVDQHEKSVAFSVVLQNLEHTWTDHDIQILSDNLVAAVSQQFKARLRDGGAEDRGQKTEDRGWERA